MYLQNRNRIKNLENEFMVTRDEELRDREFGNMGLTCTHCYI